MVYQTTPERVAVWFELVRCVRVAMILDVMHEFITTEVPEVNWVASYWHDAVEENQQDLEELFAAIKLGHLEGWIPDKERDGDFDQQ